MKTIKIATIALSILISGILSAQSYSIDTQRSILAWTGKKVTGEHNGNISLKEGSLVIKDNRIEKGNFVIDMTSITNNDLESEEYNQKLVGHLKSDDFFGVEKFPTAKLTITKAGVFKKNVAEVTGDLTIKGITHPISFTVSLEGSTYNTSIIVDRSKYDVRYGSGSFFDNLGDKMIYDDFTMDVKIALSK